MNYRHVTNKSDCISWDHPVKRLNIGVIGAEHRGVIAQWTHCPEKGRSFVGACTLHPENIAWMKEKYGPEFLVTGDYRELLGLKDLDAVFICSPDHLHEEHTLAAIEAGKHVYLEKPMAVTVEGCDRILDAAARRGTSLYVGHNMRFFPGLRKIKELIEAGAIGRVESIWCRHFISYGGDAYFRDWHAERRFSHGLLLQKAAHDIDVIHWFAGAYTRRVVGMGKLSVYDKLPRRESYEPTPSVEFNSANWPPASTGNYNPNIDVEDHSMLLMQLGNGVQASYLQCHYTPDDQRNYTVIGTAGRLENYGLVPSESGGAAVHLWTKREGATREGNEIFPIPEAEGGHGGADPLIVEDFLNFLQNGSAASGATPLDARMAVAAGYYGTESLRNENLAYDVPPPRRASGTPVPSDELVAPH